MFLRGIQRGKPSLTHTQIALVYQDFCEGNHVILGKKPIRIRRISCFNQTIKVKLRRK